MTSKLSYPPARLTGAVPKEGSGKTYRIQVGSYKNPRFAVNTFSRLQEAGLNPAYEKSGDVYRVVLAGITPEMVEETAVRLGSAGFPEALVREEP